MTDRSGSRYRVTNVSRDAVLAEESQLAATPVRRGVGLIGRRGLPPGGGLIIRPCNSVVSFFMRFPIDVVFVGADNHILHILHSMVPWRTSRIVRGSKFVVELPSGTCQNSGTMVGDRIDIEPAL